MQLNDKAYNMQKHIAYILYTETNAAQTQSDSS